VNPAQLVVTAASKSMTYGGTVPALTYTYTGLVNGDTSATFTGSLTTTATSSSGVASYPINQGTLAATGNYTIGTFNAGTLAVNPAQLVVTAASKSMTYGGTVPALIYAYTGLVNGDTSATFSGSMTTTATSASGVGSYPINQGTLAATGNYTIGTFNAGTLAVNPAQLVVTAASKSMTYGGTVPALTYTYTGLVNGDPSATFSGVLATTATSSTSVGGYPITQGTLAATGNYTIGTFNPGTLTVNAAPLTITPTTGQSMVYGGTVPALTYTASGFVNGDPASLLTGALGTTATSTSVVGNYPFTLGSLTAGTNYALALAANPPTFAVTPATLSVTANPETKVYGSADPALTYAASGFQLSDTAGTVLTGALTRTAGETVAGSPYAINQGTLAADANYTISFTGSSLTITPATPTITWANPGTITYGTALSATQLDATASWTVGGNTVNVPGCFTYNPAAGTVLSAGNNQTLSVSFTPTDTSDYTNASATTSINVTQHATATATALVASTPEGAPGQTITFTATVASGLPSPYVPTGSVQFQVNGANVGSPVPLTASDTAAFSTTEPASGSFTVTAVYSGDANFTSSRSPTYTESVLSPGVYAVGTTLYVVGANTSDYALISPWGSKLDGSTGLAVLATLNNAITAKAFNQTFTAIDVFGYGGNDIFLLIPTLTLPTTVVEGNGNNYVLLAAGNDSVTFGSGSNHVFGGNGNKTITDADAAGTSAYISLGNGNDTISLGAGNDQVALCSGNNTVTAGNGNDTITLGDGSDSVSAGDGNDNVTVGNGNDNVQLGNGSDVIVEGNGNDNVSAGNGSDLVVGGLGPHTIQLGNGNDILIDGSATVVKPGDSLRQILSDWNTSSSALVNKRLKVVYKTSHPNVLKAGSGRDWFFFKNSNDVTNQKPTDRVN